MAAAEVLRFVEGREQADCAIAALAMFLGMTYEDVLRAVTKLGVPQAGKVGLTTHEIRRVAAACGTPLRLRRKIEEDDYGILLLRDHAMVLRAGLVFDPVGAVWDFDDYLRVHPEVVVEGVLIER